MPRKTVGVVIDEPPPEVAIDTAPDQWSRVEKFLITGLTALLQHNPIAMLSTGQGDKIQEKKIPTPEEEAKIGRYVTPEGYLYVPTIAIRNAIVSGGKGRRVKKFSASSILKSGVMPVEEKTLLLEPDTQEPIRADDYEVDLRPASVPGSSGRGRASVLRARPKIWPWCCRVALEVDSIIDVQIVVQAGQIGGRLAGIGDYRPERGGPFGRFTIELIH